MAHRLNDVDTLGNSPALPSIFLLNILEYEGASFFIHLYLLQFFLTNSQVNFLKSGTERAILYPLYEQGNNQPFLTDNFSQADHIQTSNYIQEK